jgi:hypothetical protein
MKKITAKSQKSQKVFRSKFDFSLPYSTYSTSWLKILRLPPEIICYLKNNGTIKKILLIKSNVLNEMTQ